MQTWVIKYIVPRCRRRRGMGCRGFLRQVYRQYALKIASVLELHLEWRRWLSFGKLIEDHRSKLSGSGPPSCDDNEDKMGPVISNDRNLEIKWVWSARSRVFIISPLNVMADLPLPGGEVKLLIRSNFQLMRDISLISLCRLLWSKYVDRRDSSIWSYCVVSMILRTMDVWLVGRWFSGRGRNPSL